MISIPVEILHQIFSFTDDPHTLGCISQYFRAAYTSFITLTSSHHLLRHPSNFLAFYNLQTPPSLETIPYTRTIKSLTTLPKSSYTRFIIEVFSFACTQTDNFSKFTFTETLIFIVKYSNLAVSKKWNGTPKLAGESDFESLIKTQIPLPVRINWLRLSFTDTPESELHDNLSVYDLLLPMLPVHVDLNRNDFKLSGMSEDNVKFLIHRNLFLPFVVTSPSFYDRWIEYVVERDWVVEMEYLLSVDDPATRWHKCDPLRCWSAAVRFDAVRCLNLLKSTYGFDTVDCCEFAVEEKAVLKGPTISIGKFDIAFLALGGFLLWYQSFLGMGNGVLAQTIF